jgi:hypothetical protein
MKGVELKLELMEQKIGRLIQAVNAMSEATLSDDSDDAKGKRQKMMTPIKTKLRRIKLAFCQGRRITPPVKVQESCSALRYRALQRKNYGTTRMA